MENGGEGRRQESDGCGLSTVLDDCSSAFIRELRKETSHEGKIDWLRTGSPLASWRHIADSMTPLGRLLLPTSQIRMGYLQSDLHQLAAFVCLEKGFYKAEGRGCDRGGHLQGRARGDVCFRQPEISTLGMLERPRLPSRSPTRSRTSRSSPRQIWRVRRSSSAKTQV